MDSIISIKGLTKVYDNGFQALKGVDLDIKRGEILALLGPNGAGKTTLISIITGIDYEVKLLIPATHAAATQKIGASRSALPILKTVNGKLVEGSADIIVWANQHGKKKILINTESTALEKQADDVLGVHIRRWFYSEVLLDCPEIVKPVFSNGASLKDKIILNLAWPKIVKTMIKRMDLGFQQENESKSLVLKEFDKVDELLINSNALEGEPHLLESQLSNADIAIASLIAPLIGPAKHPASSVFSLPPRIVAMSTDLNDRPMTRWLERLYQQHR